jgi:hypothetical protein
MNAYAIYEDQGSKITERLSCFPKEWYSPLRHGRLDDMTAEQHAAIYGLPPQHPDHPEYLFAGCVSGESEIEAARRSGHPFAGDRGSF